MSALDGRIRTIAHEVATSLLEGTAPATAPSADRVAELETQVASLTARLDALEKAASGHQDKPTARRSSSSRKTETSE